MSALIIFFSPVVRDLIGPIHNRPISKLAKQRHDTHGGYGNPEDIQTPGTVLECPSACLWVCKCVRSRTNQNVLRPQLITGSLDHRTGQFCRFIGLTTTELSLPPPNVVPSTGTRPRLHVR
ncbi:hypothetical protein PoB_003000600 [Plakobranchus ocellatus]|uniref:Uncharacterized protein n=1 Tax=Plakobranchus ocellatus TaxID=259542 RepID=A0AAV4A5G0_9GAST|nr:hypothetical protein PoB_003000600 [Plakobranchus ocellatus]